MYLTQGLHRVVQQRPDEVATICDGRVRIHAESVDRIARLAAAFQSLGIRDGQRAAILSANSDRFHEFVCATLWAGGVVVPVNFRWSVAEIAESLDEVDARLLVVDDAFAACADGIKATHPGLEKVIHAGNGPTPDGMLAFEELVETYDPVEDERRSGDRLAGIFYTGGTTGRSKGVMVSHDNLLTSAMGWLATDAFQPGGVLLYVAPMFHLAAFSSWVTNTVLGGTQVMIGGFDPVAVMTAVDYYQVTDLTLVTTMIQMTVDNPRIDGFDLSSVRRVMYGASPISDALLSKAMKVMPNARFMQGYGMTESPLSPPSCGRTTTMTRAAGSLSAAPRRTSRCASLVPTTPRFPGAR